MRPTTTLGKLRKFWNSLNEKEKEECWDYMTALRSSDLNRNSNYKHKSVAVLRSYLIDNYINLCDVNFTDKLKKLPNAFVSHFETHFNAGVDVVNKHYKVTKKNKSKRD